MTRPHKLIRYLPAQPLLNEFDPELSNGQIADRLGTTRNRVRKMRQPNARVTWIEADRFAIRIGSHPAYIWGALWGCEVSPVEQKVAV